MCAQNKEKCSGCGNTFSSYNMMKSEAVKIDGASYCNQDCQLESESKAIESCEWSDLSAEY